jgi:hypothetical protein
MESPINTWFDGVDCVPNAWRRKCKTMVIRRNGVMDISAAGSNTIKVSDSAICMGRLSVVAVPLAPSADSGEFVAGAPNAIVPNRTPRNTVRSVNLVFLPDGRGKGDLCRLQQIAAIGRQSDEQRPVRQTDQVQGMVLSER